MGNICKRNCGKVHPIEIGALTDQHDIIRHTLQKRMQRMESMAFSGVRDSKTYNQIHINVPQRTTKPKYVSSKENVWKSIPAGEGGAWGSMFAEQIIPTFIPLRHGFNG